MSLNRTIKDDYGLTLVEFMITIVLLSILAGLSGLNAFSLRESAYDTTALQDYRNILVAIESLNAEEELPERFRLKTLSGPTVLPNPFELISLSEGVRLSRFNIQRGPNRVIDLSPANRPPVVPPGLQRDHQMSFDIEHLKGSKRYRYSRVGDRVLEQILER